MKSTIGFFCVILLVALGCENSDEYVSVEIRMVIIEDDDASCGLPVIEFYQGADEIKKLTKSSSDFYIAQNLDEELAIEGKKYKVAVRKTEDEELGPCLASDPWYPWITIIEVEEVD